jgi:protocatechuate 3,4-dioxygenase beta subunit
MRGTAEGIPLAVKFRVVDTKACAPLVGSAVYVWLCDRDGRYSLYSSAPRTICVASRSRTRMAW